MIITRIELLKEKIRLLKAKGMPTDDYEAELAELCERAKQYPRISELSDMQWIIEGILAEKGITIIGGLTDTGKTTLSLQLCGCLIEQQPFLGIVSQTRVNLIAYACLDQSTGMLKDQVMKMERVFPSIAQMRVITDITWNGRVILGLTEAIEFLQPQIIVIDALNALLGTADENIAMGPIMREFRRINEKYGTSLIIPHQFRKPPVNGVFKAEPTAQDFRGSTEIGAKAEVLLALQRMGLEVRVKSVKSKSVNKVDLELRQDPVTLIYSVCVSRVERMRKLLNEGMSPKDVIEVIYEEYGGNWNSIKTMVYREKREMEESGNDA